MVSTAVTEVPAPFARALGTLRDAARTLRIQVQEVPAPRAARYSVALEGTLADPGDDAHELADGTFVVLFDPPKSGANLILWLAGPAAVLLGGGIAFAAFRRRGKVPEEGLTAEEQARLEEILKR